ncbi:MAG: hypothetical protein JWN40_5901 [Phycisphaerales bacterium]|nr:hypothetical protein [Phycisphaerales bacterium]
MPRANHLPVPYRTCSRQIKSTVNRDWYALEALEPRVLLSAVLPALEQDAVIVRDGGDGRVVVAGVLADDQHVLVARLKADGSLDPTFGRDGIVLLENLWILDEVEVRPDGQMLVMADATSHRTVIFRLNVDGGVDMSFGTGGRVLLPAPNSGVVFPGTGMMAVQSDSRILTVERGADPGGGILVSRYGPDGVPDSSFGTGGAVAWSGSSPQTPWPDSISPSADGGIQLVLDGVETLGFMIMRWRADGSPDPAFGEGRMVMGDPGGYAYFLGTLSDGRVLTDSFWLNRTTIFRPDGSREGVFAVEAPTSVLQLSGRGNRLIFATNPDGLQKSGQFALLSFTAEGMADPSFGDGGRLVISDDPGITPWWMQLSAASNGDLIEAHLGEPASPEGQDGYPTELVINRMDAGGRPVETFGIHGRAVFRLEGTGESEPGPAEPPMAAAQPHDPNAGTEIVAEAFGADVPAIVRNASAFLRGDHQEAILNGLLGRRIDDSLLGFSVDDLLRAG